jgi:FKBP-type peptidyl-prolyl cis-trans isomerase
MKALSWRIIVLAAAPVLLAGCKGEGEGEKKATASGVRYVDLAEGEGRAAVFGDAVQYSHTCWLADGREFEKSSPAHPHSTRLGWKQPFEGMDEGMEGMKASGKRKLWIPSRLAYGTQGSPPRVPPNADIIVEVEMLRVTSTEEVMTVTSEVRKKMSEAEKKALDERAAEVSKPASGKDIPEAERKDVTSKSGLTYIDERIGDGRAAVPGTVVSVYYVGRLANNSKFDFRTSGDGYKLVLGTGQVIKGWDEGIVGMRAGGKRKLIIPPELGYGKTGKGKIPRDAVLYFDIELLRVE